MPPKKELSANTLPAKVPAEPKTEGFSAGYLTPLINSVTLPANSPATKADIAEVITAVLTLASISQRSTFKKAFGRLVAKINALADTGEPLE